MKLLQAIPASPVQDIARSTAFYRDQFGFTVHVEEDGFAILRQGTVDIDILKKASAYFAKNLK